MSLRIASVSIVLAAVAGGLFFWLGSGEETRSESAAAAPVEPAGAEAAARPKADLSSPGAQAAQEAAQRRLAARSETPERAETTEAAASLEAAGPRLAGRVVDRFGNPLQGAEILFQPESALDPFRNFGLNPTAEGESFEALSGEGGRFEVGVTGVEPLAVSVRLAGFAPFDTHGLVAGASGVTELEDFALTPGAILRGVVIDSGGVAIAGAELFVEDRHSSMRLFGSASQPVAVSDSNGVFAIEHLACGPWRVRVQSEEHPTGTFEGLADRPGEVVEGLEFELQRGSTIDGRIAGLPEDMDAADLVARAYPVGEEGLWNTLGAGVREASLRDDGSFKLRGLASEGTYRVQARRRARQARGFTGARSLSDAVEAQPGGPEIVLAFQPEAAVTLQVVDTDTGRPIETLDVAGGMRWPMGLRDGDGRIQRSFPDGQVRFADLRKRDSASRFQLEVSAVGYEAYKRDDIEIVPGQDTALGIVALTPVPVVHVTVVDESGRPVEGALATLRVEEEEVFGAGTGERRFSLGVRVEEDSDGETIVRGGGEMQSGRTDAQGLAVLTSLQGERCQLSVTADGFAPAQVTGLELPRGERVEQRVVLTPGGSVVVTVLSAAGEPLAGIEVAHRAPSAGPRILFGGQGGRRLTDTQGQLRFRNLGLGVHGFQIRDAGEDGLLVTSRFAVQMDGVDAGGDDWTEIEVVGSGEQSLVLQMSERGSLAGRVLEAGVPLVGANLKLRQKKEESPQEQAMRLAGFGTPGPSARTDGDGDYSVDSLEVGTWIVEVSHPTRQMPDEFEVEIRGAERLDLDLPVTVLEGRVTDPEGEPMAGVRVTTERAGAPQATAMRVMFVAQDGDSGMSIDNGGETEFGYTDADGYYELRGVQSGVELLVNGTHPSAQPGQSEPVEVAAGEVRSGVDLVLEPGGEVLVQVSKADGSDPGFALARGEFLGESEQPVEDQRGMVANGRATLSGLRPGLWRISVSPMGPGGGGEPVSTEVEVRAGETAEAPITL